MIAVIFLNIGFIEGTSQYHLFTKFVYSGPSIHNGEALSDSDLKPTSRNINYSILPKKRKIN